MVINKVDFDRILAIPTKCDSPILVDPKGVAPRLSLKAVKSLIVGNHILGHFGHVERIQQDGYPFDEVGTKTAAVSFLPKLSQRFAAKRSDHCPAPP
jgi:hypothetical protein